MANSSVNLVNLDFDTLKSSFVTYLKQQTQFQDYNFDGAALNVLLDILSYNTYKNAFYTNMIFSESFLDSAQMRESIYSHSKELNYLPRSARSSVANVTINFTATGESQPYVIQKGETFSTVIKQNSYTFSVAEDVILTSSNNNFTSTFDIYEGFYVKDSYVMDYTTENQKFKLTNDNVDTNSLIVLVYEDGEQTPKKFLRATSLLGLTETSQVYFIQGTTDAKYEVVFGDNILGRKPKNGSTIILDYRVTAGSAANGARSFSVNFDPTATNSELTSPVTVSVNKYTNDTQGSYSVNGAEQESLESIRYYAPRHFQTQERAVTVNDYEIMLKTQFPEIGAISVYGGEEVSPPRYGKVFVAVDIKNVEGLPESKKLEYYNFIKSRSPLSIDPIFTEPAFTYVQVKSKVKYNINLTTRTTQNIKADVMLTIDDFSNTYLNDFKTSLRYSKLVRAIDDVDMSIISNETELHAYKKLLPRLSVPQNINLDFNFPIEQTDYVSNETAFVTSSARHEVKDTRAVHSTFFRYNGEKCLVEDDGAGKLRVVKEEGGYHYVIREVGTVNYSTGEIKLINFTVDLYDGNYFKLYVSPKNKDILGSRNEILSIEPDEVLVTVEAIRE